MRDTYFYELDGALVAIEDGDVRSVVCDGSMCGEFCVPEDSAVVWEIGGGLRFVSEPVAMGGDFGVAKDGMVDELGDGVVSVFVFGGGEEGATGADVLDGFFVRFAESAEGGGGGVVDVVF